MGTFQNEPKIINGFDIVENTELYDSYDGVRNFQLVKIQLFRMLLQSNVEEEKWKRYTESLVDSNQTNFKKLTAGLRWIIQNPELE